LSVSGGQRRWRSGMSSARGSCSMPLRVCTTPRSPCAWTRLRGLSGSGDDGSPSSAWMGLRTSSARVARAVFPPQQVAEVKAIACELPLVHGLPLSRFSRVELHRLVVERGVTDASASTIWRWLHEDAIKPWQTRSWIFPRDRSFAEKAGRALDLYARIFEGKRLRPDEYVICADEKSQLQALGRRHETVPVRPGASGAGRVRVSPRRDAGLPSRLGRPPRQPLGSRRGQDRDQTVRPPRR
jgi:hypothetical protein